MQHIESCTTLGPNVFILFSICELQWTEKNKKHYYIQYDEMQKNMRFYVYPVDYSRAVTASVMYIIAEQQATASEARLMIASYSRFGMYI